MFLRYPNVVPCLNNIAYYSKEADLLSANPVLGILHFTFHSGVDVSESSQAASILWRKSLEFVSTIPGFQSLYWAPIVHNSPCQQIIVLIQWDSGRGWSLFQFSLGFSMMLGYVQSVFNRCIQLALPSDLLHFDSVLEMISFQFPTMLSTSQIDMQPVFKDKWETEFIPYLSTSTAMAQLSHACGEWVEPDKVSEDRFFIGLFFWKPDTQDNIADQIAEMGKYATNVLQESDLLPVTVQSQINHPAFQNPVKPKFNLDDSILRREDLFYLESRIEARRNERIACGPAGCWYPMAYISQHNLPQAKYGSETNMKMVSFRARIENAPVDSLFEGLRRKLWALGDCPRLLWGKEKRKEEEEEEENSDKILLFIEPQRENKEFHPEFQRIIQEFSDECGDAIQDLCYRSMIGPSRFFMRSNMDITIFDVSENEMDQRSFEYAFTNYKETTFEPEGSMSRHSPWSALIPGGQAWVINDLHFSSSDQRVQFISIFSSDKRGAQEEWYSDFAQRAQTQYDLLGHIVDWIRTLSKRITIQYLVLEKDDPWIIADRLEKSRRPPSPVPRSIFDLPWLKNQSK